MKKFVVNVVEVFQFLVEISHKKEKDKVWYLYKTVVDSCIKSKSVKIIWS